MKKPKITDEYLSSLTKLDIKILEDLCEILMRDKEHIMKEREKIRKQYPRLEPLVGLAAPEVAKVIERIKKIKNKKNEGKQ